MTANHDPVNHPEHYTSHPSGIECIDVTEHMSFNLGNAVKYIWRADLKGDALEDLRKAAWYVEREIARRTASGEKNLRCGVDSPALYDGGRAVIYACALLRGHTGDHSAASGATDHAWPRR